MQAVGTIEERVAETPPKKKEKQPAKKPVKKPQTVVVNVTGGQVCAAEPDALGKRILDEQQKKDFVMVDGTEAEKLVTEVAQCVLMLPYVANSNCVMFLR